MNDMQLAADLRDAVSRGEVSAWFQPQVDLATNRIVAVEALCRWNHPERGMVPPAVFIPIAEESGLIQEIGQFMVDQSCAAAAKWVSLEHPVAVSVNVSPAQLATSEFTDRLAIELERLDLPPRALTIEITESMPIEDIAVVVSRLDELRRLGLGIAVDDYGAGHSSLAQLDSLHATELKIDQSLVRDDSVETHELLAAVIERVHESGLQVVAEGVETAEQLAHVRELGFDRAQGYLIAKPMPQDELERLLG